MVFFNGMQVKSTEILRSLAGQGRRGRRAIELP